MNPSQEYALYAILGENDVELALKFETFSQAKALRILGKKNAGLALKFHTDGQVDALEILCEKYVELSLDRTVVDTLEELNKKNIELALRFRTLNQFKALEILGKENAELALKFTDSQQVEALELIPTTLLLADIKCIEQINAIVNGHSFEEAIAISCPQEDAHVTTAGDIVSE